MAGGGADPKAGRPAKVVGGRAVGAGTAGSAVDWHCVLRMIGIHRCDQQCRTAARVSVAELTPLVSSCRWSRPYQRTVVIVTCDGSSGGPGRHVMDIRARRGCQQTLQRRPKASSPEWTWRQRRWTNAASSRRAESVAGSRPAGLSRPARRISIPEIRTAPLGSEIPATEITAPTRSRIPRQRVRAVLARRATPRTVSSAPTRSRQRSRLIRAGRLVLRGVDLSDQPPEDVHTTIRWCDRSLIAASNTHARRVAPEGEKLPTTATAAPEQDARQAGGCRDSPGPALSQQHRAAQVRTSAARFR